MPPTPPDLTYDLKVTMSRSDAPNFELRISLPDIPADSTRLLSPDTLEGTVRSILDTQITNLENGTLSASTNLLTLDPTDPSL